MNILNHLTLSKCVRFFLYVFIFLQPVNRFNSFREIAFGGLLVFSLLKLFKGGMKDIRFSDKTIIALFALAAWSLLVSLLGPYPVDSLSAMKNNLLAQILIFFVIITEFKTLQELKGLFWVVVLSFSAVTLPSVFEAIILAQSHELIKSHEMFTHKMFIGGYANLATFYLPFILAWLIAFDDTRTKKWIGSATFMIGIALVFVYSHRTALIALPSAFFIMLLLTRKYKILLAACLFAVIAATAIGFSKSDVLARYRSLGNPKTYITNTGVSGRFAVWEGALQIIKERPIIGYGYGWKKVAWVARDLNLADSWKQDYPHIYAYYVDEAHLSYGRVNPHSLVLQILFEIGAVGLLIFLWFWATIIHKIIKIGISKEQSDSRSYMLCSVGVLTSYLMINIPNGFWEDSYGRMIFFFIASLFVTHRQHVNGLKPQE